MQRRKIPWLAALMNLFLPGTGYIYVGSRVRFGVLLVAAMVIAIFSPPVEGTEEMTRAEVEVLLQDPAFISILIAGVLIATAFAYDAWSDARTHNEHLSVVEEEKDDV